ncbi:MAG: aminoacyl-tRNA deacylase [Anaerolineales bacterium]
MVDQDSYSSGETPVTRALDALGISYRFFRHEGEVTSLEQAARERGQAPQQVIRSIVFRLSEGEFVMVLVAGPAQISWPALRIYLGQSRLTLATKDEILAVTGYPIGAVSPFGLPNPVRILVDRSVIQGGEVSIGSGERNTTVILDNADLIRALGQIEVADLIQLEP